MNFKKFFKNSKAISPIFATLILIAIAVIAGVVVYMFTSGTLATMTGGGTAAQEKVSVQGFSLKATNGALTVYSTSTNGLDVSVSSIIVKDQTGATIGILTPTSPATSLGTLTKDGALGTITGTATGSYTVGNTYSVTLTTAKGGSFVSSGQPAS